MSPSRCFAGTYYYHLHPHKNISHEISTKNNLNAKTNSIIYAASNISSSSSSRLKRCSLKAKSSIASKGFKREPHEEDKEKKQKRIRILIAGGGIGGLVLALAAKNRGFDVTVFEKDLTVVKGEGRHRDRGPIQLVSSALGVLESIDKGVANQVMDAGCFIGNRINGLADGLFDSFGYLDAAVETIAVANVPTPYVANLERMAFPHVGSYFYICNHRNFFARIAKLDLLTPAMNNGLPTTLLISRMALQEILLNALGDHIVLNKSKVVDFSQDINKVVVTLDDGQQFEGDILVGADGIWSEVKLDSCMMCLRIPWNRHVETEVYGDET
ncbi:hypothetical protein OSB04_001497 [Centaurea solstitialis]|uniref:Zeaxanthin epoxidase n=1 Tax=Centaurea solstitialis TaxID=347529 RepID=A0AA38U3Q0_9ASTR|nr:hypothetical protein OSB04_001497 [Centaurea solstitialis]